MRALCSLTLLAACAAPAPPPVPNLAPAFHEDVHGFTMAAPALRLVGDELVRARYDERDERLLIDGGGSHTSGWILWEAPFDEVLASWNARVPEGAGLAFELQVATKDGTPSPWLYMGQAGRGLPKASRTTEFEGGKVAVDVLQLGSACDRVRLRLTAIGETQEPVEVHRTSLCFTDRARLEELRPAPATGPVSIDVPARSQRIEEASLASRICSPTSVAMVLEAGGVDVPTTELAALIYDADHDLYGNWPRAVQAAFGVGVPGTLVRLSSWRAVEQFLTVGVPLVVSVGAEKGELRGAPYERTSGHLLVIRGLDERGDVLVNDPAADDLAGVPRTYAREDMERCWMRRGGVAYAIGQ